MPIVVKPMRTHWDTTALGTMFRMRSLGSSWEQIADQLPGRTADAVRLEYHRRWTPELQATLPAPDPTTTRASQPSCPRVFWSPEEDAKILHGVKLHGKSWRKILAMVPGRSDSSVRNRAKRLLQMEADAKAAAAHAAASPEIAASPFVAASPIVPVRSASGDSGPVAGTTPQPAEQAPFAPSASLDLEALVDGIDDIVAMRAMSLSGPSAEPLSASPRRGNMVTFEHSSLLPLRRETPARLSFVREVADDGRRERVDDLLSRRSRNDSRRDESDLDEGSLTSNLEELSASLKALGLISGYKSTPRQISLDELENVVREEVVV